MRFEPVQSADLNDLTILQPEDWPDIIPKFRFYLEYDFCFPYKIKINNQITGAGVFATYGNTSWIAHVIVHMDYRNKGIGSAIVDFLVKEIRKRPVRTISLVSTDLGKPVYLKAGFEVISDYIFFERSKPGIKIPFSGNIIPFENKYHSKVMDIDRRVSGEERDSLLKDFRFNSFLFREKDRITGFYVPDLGEGLIIAENKRAGTELMKLKYMKNKKAVIPEKNKTGIRFLEENGFADTGRRGTRMILGRHIHWKPEKIYARIGGNFG